MMLLPKLRAWQWIVLVLVLAFAVDWFIQRPDDKARALNAARPSVSPDTISSPIGDAKSRGQPLCHVSCA